MSLIPCRRRYMAPTFARTKTPLAAEGLHGRHTRARSSRRTVSGNLATLGNHFGQRCGDLQRAPLFIEDAFGAFSRARHEIAIERRGEVLEASVAAWLDLRSVSWSEKRIPRTDVPGSHSSGHGKARGWACPPPCPPPSPPPSLYP